MALLSFRAPLTDPADRLSSWQVDRHQNCCEWYGIQCSTDSLHIISMDLRNVDLEITKRSSLYLAPTNTSLTGTISPSLFKLTRLQYLDLSFNTLDYSQIQYQLSNFKNLVHLDVSFSQFSDSVTTQFSNLSSLRYLDISSFVQASDPASTGPYSVSEYPLTSPSINWVRNLVNLRVLKMSGVDLYDASMTRNWAEPISYLGDLRELHLSYCHISSPGFPIREFFNLSRLSILKMSFNNDINSSITAQIANLNSLSVLELAECYNLQGSIPYLPQLKKLDVRGTPNLNVNLSSMFKRKWPKLQTLWISSTSVNGPIPQTISNAPILFSFSASGCSIKGSLTTTISALSNLEYLDLSSNGITGYIPPAVSSMKRLHYLSLFRNSLQGPIPSSICKITLLQHLSLYGNNLTGTIPSCFTELIKLSHLDVSDNSVGGVVSLNSLMNKLNLTKLNLNNNSLTVEINHHQPFPSGHYHLESLELQSCNISGNIPAFICEFKNLDKLDLSSNNLTGAIPSCLFKHQTLSHLDLSENNLQGTLPRVLHFNDNTFIYVKLASNFLQGSLPVPSEKNMYFDLSENQFTGRISVQHAERLSNSRYASLSGNQLSGSIPPLCSNKFAQTGLSLQTLDLSNNSLTGSIPSSFGNCSSLVFLHLGMNNLTGEVPYELQHTRIKYLLLHNNLLEGTFPNFIRKLETLEVLTLGNNNFQGSIPTFVGSFRNLKIFSLRSNAFNGSVPRGISYFNKLQILDLSSNYLSGSIPSKIGNITKLTSRPNDTYAFWSGGWAVTDLQLQMVIKGVSHYIRRLHGFSSGIDLSSNNLEGNIPEDIGLLQGLSMLNLSNNHLTGKIPNSVGNMTGLESLDLSFNSLSGEIPSELVSVSNLGRLNLSYNNLSGRIPEDAHFQTLSTDGSAYLGNKFLCGVPTERLCEGDLIVPTSSINNAYMQEEDKDSAREKGLLYGAVTLGVGVGFGGLFLVLLCGKEKWWSGYWRVVDTTAERITDGIWKK
ncbi:LRR receptor-like serine/threonine-protein kinase GSO1 [Papaver somniferum]|uniref:LRR receptor-like serine/threonine-protein kinase GSO1 n=1 Tax=Papaver somniferum TaxID=3469 RepID=UPI000E7049A2|nr:LRR receptor-like serine/threonine-protein kinase GSO1 [Papaver somniferum]